MKNTNNQMATIKQLEFIKDIEEFVDEKFTGKTKKEASDYIGRNIEIYKLNSASNWVIVNGYE